MRNTTSSVGRDRGNEPKASFQGRLALSLGITAGFVLVEAAAGLFANSLALLTDAAHNLTDVLALALTWYALRVQRRPAGAMNTYGNHRAGILVALVNSTTLVLISLGVFYEAYRRLLAPPEVVPQVLVLVGTLAVIVNLTTALLIRRRGETDLNVRAAFLHLMGDVASTAAAVVAGVVIYYTGANWLDSIASVFIGLLILFNAWGILRESVNILLEFTPRDVDMNRMVGDMLLIEGVQGVHDLHVWSLTKNLRTMSAHVLTDDVSLSAGSRIQRELNALLDVQYGITHATLQLECANCGPEGLYCGLEGSHDVHAHH
jgi:cobalt-zinc-cadmium efflux system protein